MGSGKNELRLGKHPKFQDHKRCRPTRQRSCLCPLLVIIVKDGTPV